jgi:hypothetical protein
MSSAAMSFQLGVAHGLHGAVIGGERVVERDLVLGQAQVFAAPWPRLGLWRA